ncbi:hypothetical protein D9M70_308200 [compost metagenome]
MNKGPLTDLMCRHVRVVGRVDDDAKARLRRASSKKINGLLEPRHEGPHELLGIRAARRNQGQTELLSCELARDLDESIAVSMAIIQRLAIGPVTEAVVQHRHRPSRHRTRQVSRKSRLAHATVCVDDNRALCGEQRRQDVCLLRS